VRTPLNSIINYLEVALEETLDVSANQDLLSNLAGAMSLDVPRKKILHTDPPFLNRKAHDSIYRSLCKHQNR
jgi:signal transduction histidine kinase